MTDRYILRHVIPAAYALLPAAMRSHGATAMLLAIGALESEFRYRRQISGPARSFWQFERNGIRGVLTHAKTQIDIQVALSVLCYPNTVDACHAAVEHNDVLAALFARLLLWTVPRALPGPNDAEEAWQQYLSAWRPGKPRPWAWHDHYGAAWDAIQKGGVPIA